MSSSDKLSKGNFVQRRKNSDGNLGVIVAILGDYIRISFPGKSPNKIRKKDFDSFYEVVQPPEGYTHPVSSPSTAKKSVSKRRRRVKKVKIEDDSDIQVGVIIRTPIQKWGLGVITKIKSDEARIVFMDHYTKMIPLTVVGQYFIPIEPSRFVPKELTDPKNWTDLHNRNQAKFDARYDPWNIEMFK